MQGDVVPDFLTRGSCSNIEELAQMLKKISSTFWRRRRWHIEWKNESVGGFKIHTSKVYLAFIYTEMSPMKGNNIDIKKQRTCIQGRSYSTLTATALVYPCYLIASGHIKPGSSGHMRPCGEKAYLCSPPPSQLSQGPQHSLNWHDKLNFGLLVAKSRALSLPPQHTRHCYKELYVPGQY